MRNLYIGRRVFKQEKKVYSKSDVPKEDKIQDSYEPEKRTEIEELVKEAQKRIEEKKSGKSGNLDLPSSF